MKHSKLTWEDVSQYEEVAGYGQHIWKRKGKYYFVTEEGGIAVQRVVYELPLELFKLLDSEEKSLADIHFKLRNDVWPPTEEERKDGRRKFLMKHPASLIGIPKNRLLFNQEELEELIPIAEKLWIEDEGKLPDGYVRIEFQTPKSDYIDIPYGNRDGTNLDPDPASGNGFIKSDEYTVPEYKANNPERSYGTIDVEEGSKMYLNIDGEEVLIGIANKDGKFEYFGG